MVTVYKPGDCVPMYIVGWTNSRDDLTSGLSIPCLLSILVGKSPSTEVEGLESYPTDQWPNVNLVFQVYHLMIDLGTLFIAIGGLACILWIWKRKIWDQRWMRRILVGLIVLTELATLSGWWTA